MRPWESLWKISVATTAEAEDAVAETVATILNCPVSSYADLKTGITTVYGFCERKSVADIRRKICTGLKRVKDCGLKIGTGKVTLTRIRREDWAESWKRHFKPVEIKADHRTDEHCESLSVQSDSGTHVSRPSGTVKSLLIRSSWSKRKARKGQIVVVLDPGLGFGTGQHPTTAFCLRELARHGRIHAQRSFLDIGTGSGILAISAAKLGFSPVRALDCDPEAVRVARANARVNGVQKKLRIERGDLAKLPIHAVKRYDLICANLISTLLLAERRRIVAQLKRGGTLVLAGILKSEFPRVQRTFTGLGLELACARTENEWRSGSFRYTRENSMGKFECPAPRSVS